ncbi:MAG: nucleotidyltransferase substrate binding protein [Deltaproteobacteria bacterium]|nr:nucleotidyltransferase substrate binding protein [Deltaproteobacteria bacterium]
MERLNERLATARRALISLLEVLAISQPSRIERDAAIQRFEYTCEAVWKTAQRYLQDVEGISVGSPKGCLRTSRDVGLLTDEQTVLGLEMIDDRNLTVHTYNEAVAEEIYDGLAVYAHLLDAWLSAIAQRMQP